MVLLNWINNELKPCTCTSDKFIYDDMASQSCELLPVIYQPFDCNKKAHWRDRGWVLDFLLSARGAGRILDFGPGDGWPSLLIAPYVYEVVGVDASPKRIEVCRDNARKLEIENAKFIHVPAGDALPFDDGSFDGITAASSIEQTPNPQEALSELYRVLKNGGRLRMSYESLLRYRGGRENELSVSKIDNETSRIDLYIRDIGKESADIYALIINLCLNKLLDIFGSKEQDLEFDSIDEYKIAVLHPYVEEARCCHLKYPRCKTWLRWLGEIGFSRVFPTKSGAEQAEMLFTLHEKSSRLQSIDEIDRLLSLPIKEIVNVPCSVENDPPITAVK